MRSTTAKLPKGQVYPLKPSKLEEALAAANIYIDVSFDRTPGGLFDAHFWPPNPNVPYERLYVRAGSAPKAEARNAIKKIDEEGLPNLVEWIAGILALDAKSPARREKQVFDFY